MKLTVSTEQNTFTLDMPKEVCENQFRRIVQSLTALGGSPDKKQEVMRINVPKKNAETIIKELNVKASVEPISTNTPSPIRRSSVPSPYKGFLYIHCPNCGEEHGFCSKIDLTHYHCKGCGVTSELPPFMTLLFVNCECGHKYTYITNITEKMFDIPCLNCGNPVPTHLNEKSGVYETIRPPYRRKG